MTNRYYAPGSERAVKVGDLFAAVARRYDLINDLQSFGLHRWWKRRAAHLAQPKTGDQALDLCCGTGDIAFELARRGATVTGLDFSEAMLEVANSRLEVLASELGGGGVPGSVHFLQGDAQAVPFPDASFDIITVGYGLRNLSDWRRGLIEMHRVARPGGRLVVLDFGKPENPLWRSCYFAYLRWFVPLFGRLFCGDAQTYGYILESLRHYPAQRGVADQMRAMQCEDVRVFNLLGGAMSINFGRKRSATAE
jgi:demethylmenaquinone methyltransferase / 2-methoxy-6-polyprenyl-1,4-benzoquinol methylase